MSQYSLVFFNRTTKRVVMSSLINNLRHFSFGDFLWIGSANTFAFIVYFKHYFCRLGMILAKDFSRTSMTKSIGV